MKNVLLYGMTEEEIRETQQSILEKAVADSHADGVKEGHKEGVIEGRAEDVDSLILKRGFTLEEACDVLEISLDDYYAYKSKQAGIEVVSEL